MEGCGGGGTVFCNPPYGREIGKWVQKAYEEAQAAHEKEQEDEDQKRADAVDMMKHIAAAFDIPATIGEGKQEEQEKEAKQLFGWYSELKKAGFTDAQAFELIKG